jgi:DNA-binding LacI/PurR family transcriptional regulator
MTSEDSAPTIFDVADLASVSVSTVSRVINGRADVSAATRTRVEQAIGRLSFAPRSPPSAWRAGAATRGDALPVVVRPALQPRPGLRAGRGGGHVRADYFFNVASDPLDEPRMRSLFRSGLVEGAILMQITAQDWRVELAAREQLPCVLIGRTDTEHPLSWVDFDFEGAVGAMVDHLVITGHRSIGFVGRSHAMLDAGLGAAIRLRRGHQQAALRHGLALHHVASDLDPLAAGQAALHLVDTVEGLSAVVATHGPSALGMLRALRSRGLRVPEDVSLLTVATSRVAELSMPSLSGPTSPRPARLPGRQHAGAPARRPGARRRPEDRAHPHAGTVERARDQRALGRP